MTEFARQLNDEEGTGVDTKQKRSTFYWDNNKYQRTIYHPQSNLPEMQINQGFGLSTLYSVLVNKIINTAVNFRYSCCFIKTDAQASGAYASEVEKSLFEIGETLFYAKDGWSGLVKVKSLSIDSEDVVKITVTSTSGEEITTTREYLRPPENPDIGWIPSSVPEYKTSVGLLSDKEIEKLASPVHLSPLQQEFLSMHHKLFHLPYTTMLRLAKFGILPRRFLKLRNDLPPCVSCMFGQAHRRPWRSKSSAKKQGGSIRTVRAFTPGGMIYADQIV